MKHLIHKTHHPHLKRRLILEMLGLAVLLPMVWRERDIVEGALTALRSSDILYLGAAISIYWVMLPLSPLSLQILTGRKIPMFNATLTHLAGSGPGRIIPGGLGTISLDVMHLKKCHTKIYHNHAIGVVATHQLVALLVNTLLVASILVYHDSFRDFLTSLLPETPGIVMVIFGFFVISLLLWLHHIRGVRERIVPVETFIRRQLLTLIAHPKRAFDVFLIASLNVFLTSLILLLTSYSLGVSMPIWDAILALSFGVLIGSLIPTPGGIGIVETGITASLAAIGYEPSHAAGVAILFRVVTYWMPLMPGLFAYLYLVDKKAI